MSSWSSYFVSTIFWAPTRTNQSLWSFEAFSRDGVRNPLPNRDWAHPLEAIEPRGVPSADEVALPLRDFGELALDYLLRIGPSGGRVREVRGPQNVLNSKVVTLLEAELIVHEGHRHVAVKVFSRVNFIPGKL